MTETRFATVSEWMTNGNINQFVVARPDANRFELVGFSFKLLPPSLDVDGYVILVVGRRREGLNLYAQPGDHPRGSKGGASSGAATASFHLPVFMC